MESTEKCEAIIQHFNGKYIKTPPGVPGEVSFFFFFFSFHHTSLRRYLIWHNIFKLVQCRLSPCYVNLLMEARRSVRAKESICRMAGPGREMGRLWVLVSSLPRHNALLYLWCTDQLHNDTALCLFISREEWLLHMTPPQPYRTGQYYSFDKSFVYSECVRSCCCAY